MEIDINDDEPEDVKRATSVEKEIRRGEKDDTFEGYPRIQKKREKWQHCSKPTKKKKVAADTDCCENRRDKAKSKTVKHLTFMIYGKPCVIPKADIIPRQCLSKNEYIKMLATPRQRCPTPYPETVVRRLKPVSQRIKDLARPKRARMLMTLQEGAARLPPAFIDNLIKTLEHESCLTPEQAAKVMRDKRRKKSKKKKYEKRQFPKKMHEVRKVGTGATTVFDRDAVTCQYMMAERFVKSILEWKCPIPRDEYQDIAAVIIKRLSYLLEYTPVGEEDRKSQQMRFLADIIACWISGVLLEVAEDRKKQLEQECEKKRLQAQAESSEDSDDNDNYDSYSKYTGGGSSRYGGESEYDDYDDDDDDGGGSRKGKRRGRGYQGGRQRQQNSQQEMEEEMLVIEEEEIIIEEELEETDEEDEIKRQEEEERIRKEQEEEERRQMEEAERKAEEERRRREEEEQREEEERQRREEEEALRRRLQEVEELNKKLEEELKIKLEEEEQRLREEEERKQREEEERIKREQEEEERRQKEEEEKILREKEEEERRQKEEEERLQREEEERIQREEEKKRQEEEEERRRQEEEERKLREEELIRLEEEARKELEEERMRAAEEREEMEKIKKQSEELMQLQEAEREKLEELEKKLMEEEELRRKCEERLAQQSGSEEVQLREQLLEKERELADALRKHEEERKQWQSQEKRTVPEGKGEGVAGLEFCETDVPFVTLSKIIDVLYAMMLSLPECVGVDPIRDRIRRALFEKLSYVITSEDANALDENLKDVLDVLCGKIASWLKNVLTESQIDFLEKYPAEVESIEVKDWTKWLVDVSDTAGDWYTWLHRKFREAEDMREEKLTREDWQDWTKAIDMDALQWRRFHLQTIHRAHQNVTNITHRKVVPSGMRKLNFSEYEIKTTNLQAV